MDIRETILGARAQHQQNITKGFVSNETPDDIEKAINRQVGDVHSNGKWVWTQLPSGKYDWRVITGKTHQNKQAVHAGVLQSHTDLSEDGFKQLFGISKKESLEKIKVSDPSLYAKLTHKGFVDKAPEKKEDSSKQPNLQDLYTQATTGSVGSVNRTKAALKLIELANEKLQADASKNRQASSGTIKTLDAAVKELGLSAKQAPAQKKLNQSKK